MEVFLPSFLTSGQDASELLAPHASRINPREGVPVSIEQNAVWDPEEVGTFRRINYVLPLPLLEPRTVQPIA